MINNISHGNRCPNVMQKQISQHQPAKHPEVIREQMASFFSEGSNQYDRDILAIVPVYEEMFEQLLDHVWLPLDASLRIVELGCGTGNLTQLLLHTYPNATLTVVDASQEMLDRTGEKLSPQDAARTTLVASYFNQLDLPAGSVDLIMSSLALHHVPDEFKPELYDSLYSWLAPGGKFRCADQCLTLPGQTGNAHNLARWQEWALSNGTEQATLDKWLEHINTADHYASLKDHFDWMATSGFAHTDCYWRTLFWAVFGAEKS